MNETKLRAALIEARDWFESQAKDASKGCGPSYELHDLRVQRDALDAALAAAPAQDDALTAAYMAGRYDAKKAAPTQAGEYPELPDCGYAKSGDIKAFGTYTAVQMRAYADATCAAREAAQAQDARQPLNDEALDLMCEQALFGRISMQQFARSIESVHGIR